MRKKVKSFALEDGPYERLSVIFKENYVDIGISYCVNRYIKEFVEYLQSIKTELQAEPSYTMPMAFIIESKAREPLFRKFDSASSVKEEVVELQHKFNAYIKKSPEKPRELDTTSLNDEIQFTKLVQLLLKIAWAEKKSGREVTADETHDLMRKIGGEDFVEALGRKTKLLLEKLEDYDPELKDLFEKMANRVLNEQVGKSRLL